MKLIVTVNGNLRRWSGLVRKDGDGGRLVMQRGVTKVETEDPTDIRGLVHVHMAYRMHGEGVIVESDDPVWTQMIQATWDREAEDYAVEESGGYDTPAEPQKETED